MGTKCEIFYIDAEIRFRPENGKSFLSGIAHSPCVELERNLFDKVSQERKRKRKKHKKAELLRNLCHHCENVAERKRKVLALRT